MRELIAALLGPDAVAAPTFGELRYQLLTATAEALVFAHAQAADVAVMIIHEFVDAAGAHTSTAKLAANARALDMFVARLSGGACSRVVPGQLVGPFQVPGNARLSATLPLVIGKARRLVS